MCLTHCISLPSSLSCLRSLTGSFLLLILTTLMSPHHENLSVSLNRFGCLPLQNADLKYRCFALPWIEPAYTGHCIKRIGETHPTLNTKKRFFWNGIQL